MSNFILKDSQITLFDIDHIISNNLQIQLDDTLIQKVNKSRLFLEDKISNTSDVIYGVNTGFGDLHNIKIEDEKLSELQVNLLRSHACGTGKKINSEIVKLMLLLKIISLSKGNSGVRIKTINRLIFLFNNNLFPIVYEYGSLGASGDLAPLAHMSLPIIGEGEIDYQGKTQNSQTILRKYKLDKINLSPKEGLALINGTQYMLASFVNSVLHSYNLSKLADHISSVSIDSYNCNLQPFSPLVSSVRNFKGQKKVSKRILDFINGGEIENLQKTETQDPYSFRCIPQVHGASLDVIDYCSEIINTEINSVTDNPLIFDEKDKIISGGNFHGQPLSLSIDFLKLSISELGNISERRTFNLMSGKRGLPIFLTVNPGIYSGLMILQYTAASLVSSNKQFSTPASIDSITSSNGQEDHVSMGANGANQLSSIITNVYDILSIELISACQAKEFNNHKTSKQVKNLIMEVRKLSKKVTKDRALYKDVKKISKFLKSQRNLIFQKS